jgi:hypothetical protein
MYYRILISLLRLMSFLATLKVYLTYGSISFNDLVFPFENDIHKILY